MSRVGPLAVGLLLLAGPAGAAEKQVRPFVAVTFAGSTTFVDSELAAGGPNRVLGVNAAWLGELVGVEADVGWAPGFLQAGRRNLVLHSGVTTVMGNIIVAAPKRLTEYTLRPYAVAGGGVMHVRIEHPFGVLGVRENLASITLGGGAMGFLSKRAGVGWDIRRIRSVKSSAPVTGVTIGGPGRLSFWRAGMAVVLRY